MKVLITGGAGFIGSNLAKELSKNNEIIVFDDMSGGKKDFLTGIKCKIVKGSILDQKSLDNAMKGVNECYHLAADPRVKESYDNPFENFQVNCEGTVKVLEACRKNNVSNFVFSSSAVVYGIAKIPTSEEAPIKPISNYGAAKAASENYIMSYSHLYKIKSTILRYANVIGPHSRYGICYDFYNKLNKNPKELEIFGDGTQEKSFVHVKDVVSATIFAKEHTAKEADMFNVGNETSVTVNEIAKVVIEFMGLKGVKLKHTEGKAGWPGDIPKMLSSIEKLRKLGWKPGYTTKEAITDTLKYLKANL